MSGARFFAERDPDDATRAWLDEDATRHARARRLRLGSVVGAILGPGFEQEAEIVAFERGRTSLSLRAQRSPTEADPSDELILVLGHADPARTDFAIEKATELGATAVVLFRAARSQSPLPAASRLARWQRLMRSACEQCGRTSLPELRVAEDLGGALQALPSRCAVFGFDQQGQPWSHALAGRSAARAAVIGPEGGLDESELQRLADFGATLVSLGPRWLRFETAAAIALGLLGKAGGVGP